MTNPPPTYNEITISKIYSDAISGVTRSNDFFDSYEVNFGNIEKYQILNPIGSGKYSTVFLGKSDIGESCAIKILKTIPFQKIKREISILTQLQGTPNVVKLFDVIKDEQSGTISLITEYSKFIHPKELFPSLSLTEIRYLMYNLLLSLDLCHQKGIMHRDIKPGNLIIKPDKKNMFIIDWGLADIYIPKQNYTVRVSTMRYKAPELLLNYEYYDYGVDVWGAGCVLGEMLLKFPFFEGRNVDEMVADVATLCGVDSVVNYVERYGLSVPQGSIALFPSNSNSTWGRIYNLLRPSKRDENAFDLLKKLLTVDHVERITAKDSLKHPFFDPIRGEFNPQKSSNETE